jgi:DNA-binding HxlR family transcriptional regulator
MAANPRKGAIATTVSHRSPSVAPPAPRAPSARDLALIDHIDGTLAVLHGKWKVHLIFLMARGIRRHGKLLEHLPGVSKKVMTDSLRALEQSGLVQRRVADVAPSRVEYSLTPLGWTITEPLIALSEWGASHAGEVREARVRYDQGTGR